MLKNLLRRIANPPIGVIPVATTTAETNQRQGSRARCNYSPILETRSVENAMKMTKRFCSVLAWTSRASMMLCGGLLLLTALGSTAYARGVPEIDPGSIGSATALLAGGVLLLTSRRRRK